MNRGATALLLGAVVACSELDTPAPAHAYRIGFAATPLVDTELSPTPALAAWDRAFQRLLIR